MTATRFQNRLLQSLSLGSRDRLLSACERVDLSVRTTLIEPGRDTHDVYFLESGLASAVATCRQGDEQIEVGHIGYEGMAGHHMLLGVDRTPVHTYMQVAGSAWRMPVDVLSHAMDTDKALRGHLLRYVQTYQLQIAYSALANGRYTIPQRLARWLLMCHDRLRADAMPLTHDFLALMLGVRRSGVTNEIHALEGEHAIRATRALVTVRDRNKLEALAGGCYGVPEAEYERLLGGTPAAAIVADHVVIRRDLSGAHILVVEDEYDLATRMQRDLTERGVDVVGPVPSVADAFELMSATPSLDGAILDVNLQGELAFPLAEALRKRNIPFVFVSGYDRPIVPQEFQDVRFYSKPVVPGEIAASLLGAG